MTSKSSSLSGVFAIRLRKNVSVHNWSSTARIRWRTCWNDSNCLSRGSTAISINARFVSYPSSRYINVSDILKFRLFSLLKNLIASLRSSSLAFNLRSKSVFTLAGNKSSILAKTPVLCSTSSNSASLMPSSDHTVLSTSRRSNFCHWTFFNFFWG